VYLQEVDSLDITSTQFPQFTTYFSVTFFDWLNATDLLQSQLQEVGVRSLSTVEYVGFLVYLPQLPANNAVCASVATITAMYVSFRFIWFLIFRG
jgi:hypothetical protein